MSSVLFIIYEAKFPSLVLFSFI